MEFYEIFEPLDEDIDAELGVDVYSAAWDSMWSSGLYDSGLPGLGDDNV